MDAEKQVRELLDRLLDELEAEVLEADTCNCPYVSIHSLCTIMAKYGKEVDWDAAVR